MSDGSEGSSDDETDIGAGSELSGVFDALSNPARMKLLLGIDAGRSMTELAEDLGMTRSGVQRHLEVLIDAKLVYRSEEQEVLYALTAIGGFFARFVRSFSPVLVEVLEQVAEREGEVREVYAELPVQEETLERMVADTVWSEMGNLEELLQEEGFSEDR